MTGSKFFFSKIIFKIMAKAPGDNETKEVGFGGRYDEITEEVIRKKKVSAIGLSLSFKKKSTKKIKLLEKKVNIHLLKIGSTSKLKYLEVLDALSKVGTPVSYDIKEEKISEQIKKAVSNNSEYAIIIGELEAKKDKVLVRKMSDFSQTEVAIKDVGKYIEKLTK
jgi:histidyl-tRNA synthetase